MLALRTASREMKLSQMKNDFVSNVSHELRTPLASIRVFGELLRLGRVESPEKVREYGEYIETESRRLTQLINNILDFAEHRVGAQDLPVRALPTCARWSAETLKTFEVRLRQSGFRHRLRAAGRAAAAGAHRRRRDRPVALATCSTTRSSTRTASKEIARRRCAREGGWVVISVTDHGIGIPRDEQQKIFDRFHRVGTGLVHDVKGSGLGLAIVRHIVEAHGGRVTVESRPGEGSTFSIHLPVDAAGAAAAAGRSADERPSEA